MSSAVKDINDDVIYGQIDNLVYPGYDLTFNESTKRFYGAVHIRDRYINNIIIDPSPGIYSYLRSDSTDLSQIDLDVILPYDCNVQEHYYVHFLTLTETDVFTLPGVRFCIEDPKHRAYNRRHIWQKRRYAALNLKHGTTAWTPCVGDLFYFVKDRDPLYTGTDLIELRDYKQAAPYDIHDLANVSHWYRFD